MKTHLRKLGRAGVPVLTSILLCAMPAAVGAQVFASGCDETAMIDAKRHFNELRTKFAKDRDSVPEWELQLAAEDYIGLNEQCYHAKFGTIPGGGQMIDEGGMIMGENGAYAAEQSSLKYVLWGGKWGAGSPFTGPGAFTDFDGPEISGGTVTYSFMPAGVSFGAEVPAPPDTNTPITGLATFDACMLEEIADAFGAWSAVADITFVPVADSGLAFDAPGATGDIRIGAHTFDGPGSVLAHAFFPPPNGTTAAGDTHFDIAEPWFCDPTLGAIDFGIVALHEFGHAIGLRHEVTDLAVMNALYNPALTFGPLADDIIGLGEIYGGAGATETTFFGPVGIGTDSPSGLLEVSTTDGTTKVFITETSSTEAPRELLELSNAGNTKFIIENTKAVGGSSWGFTNNGPDFRISQQGSGVVEMKVFGGTGNMTITGTLTQMSDRDSKTNVRPVDPQAILDRVVEIPIARWQYKAAEGVDHMGPMAQDFHRAFRLGDDPRGISSLDSGGVTLASIQALAARNAALEAAQQELLQAYSEQSAVLERLLRQHADLQRQLSVLLASQEESVAATGR